MFGAGGHLRTQKVSSSLGSEIRYDRYKWSSSLWISTESLLNAILAVLRIAVRSRGRTAGFAAICVVEGVDMLTHVAARDMVAGE